MRWSCWRSGNHRRDGIGGGGSRDSACSGQALGERSGSPDARTSYDAHSLRCQDRRLLGANQPVDIENLQLELVANRLAQPRPAGARAAMRHRCLVAEQSCASFNPNLRTPLPDSGLAEDALNGSVEQFRTRLAKQSPKPAPHLPQLFSEQSRQSTSFVNVAFLLLVAAADQVGVALTDAGVGPNGSPVHP